MPVRDRRRRREARRRGDIIIIVTNLYTYCMSIISAKSTSRFSKEDSRRREREGGRDGERKR